MLDLGKTIVSIISTYKAVKCGYQAAIMAPTAILAEQHLQEFRKILDPFADKFMQCTALVCLCIKSFVPLWFVLVFLAKELATLITGLLVIKRRSVVVVSKWYGKAAVCLFYLAIFICIVFRTFLEENPIVSIIMFATVAIFAMLAFTGYVKHYSVLKKQEIEKGTIRKVIK